MKNDIHVQPSPFPRAVTSSAGKRMAITDERCKCGRLRSEHLDTIEYGHGPMPDGSCAKFTWVGWISISL